MGDNKPIGSEKKALRIVIAGGGTGGHLFPGLAVAERLAEHPGQFRITFAGTGKELERRAVEAAGFEYLTLPCRPLPKQHVCLVAYSDRPIWQ